MLLARCPVGVVKRRMMGLVTLQMVSLVVQPSLMIMTCQRHFGGSGWRLLNPKSPGPAMGHRQTFAHHDCNPKDCNLGEPLVAVLLPTLLMTTTPRCLCPSQRSPRSPQHQSNRAAPATMPTSVPEGTCTTKRRGEASNVSADACVSRCMRF